MDAASFAATSGMQQTHQPSRQITDLASAIEIMRQLNPQCDNDQLLYRMLTSHINGEPLNLTPEEIIEAGGKQVLIPVPGSATNQALKEVGFKVKHSFRIGGTYERECLCVKVVESPEVLAVHDLFSPEELEYLRSSIDECVFEPALSTTMKVRVEDEVETQEFIVPNDGDDMCLSSHTANLPQRNCEVAFINRQSQLYKIVASRLRAVQPRECPGSIQDIAVERYLPNHFYERGHLSHQRYGAVLLPLETLPDGGLSLLSVGIQLTPLAGMGIWLPSRFDASVPDLRTDFSITNSSSIPLHYIVAWVGAKTDHKEVVQGESVPSSTDDEDEKHLDVEQDDDPFVEEKEEQEEDRAAVEI